MATDYEDIERRLDHCARCKGAHGVVIFRPFTNQPDRGPFTHYWICPKVNEPVLLQVENTEEVEPNE